MTIIALRRPEGRKGIQAGVRFIPSGGNAEIVNRRTGRMCTLAKMQKMPAGQDEKTASRVFLDAVL